MPAQDQSEERRKIRESLKDESKIQENLLDLIKKQSKEYEIWQDKLQHVISVHKESIREIQKELEGRIRIIERLEKNIIKRYLQMEEHQEKISSLQKSVTYGTVKNLIYSKEELGIVNKFKNIYSKYLKYKRGEVELSKDEISIVKEFAKLKQLTLNQLKEERGGSIQKTKQMMIQSEIQKWQMETAKHQKLIQEETNELINQQKKFMEDEDKMSGERVKDWAESFLFVSRIKALLHVVNGQLRTHGIHIKWLQQSVSRNYILIGASLFLMVLGAIVKLFKQLDAAAFVARKEMGMMRKEHFHLRKQAEDLYEQWAHLGVTVESVYKTQKSIAVELGSSLSTTKSMVEQAVLMSSQFGIVEDITIKMLKTLSQLDRTVAESKIDMVGFLGTLANAAGVPLPLVMEDIAKASETTRVMMSKVPLDMIKASVEARRLGTTLDKMTASSRNILNFTESIEAEMEASVLLGNSVNLQLARQLAYNGKISESNKEILKISKQLTFDSMDVFQAEAFAKAVGKSTDELKSMLQADREESLIRQKALELAREGDFSLQRQLESYLALKNANESIAKSRSKDYQTVLKIQANQERLTSISQTWSKILMEVGKEMLPVIDDVLKGILKILPYVLYGFKNIVQVIRFITDTSYGTIFGSYKLIYGLWNRTEGFINKLNIGGTGLTRILKTLGKFTFVLNVLFATYNVIKVIHNGIIRITDALKMMGEGKWIKGYITLLREFGRTFLGVIAGIAEGFFGFFIDIPLIILKGLKSILPNMINVAVETFDGWYNAAKDWLGFSPSKMGLRILKGITSIGPELSKSLIFPFIIAKNVIVDLFSKLGEIIISSIISPLRRIWDWVSKLFGNYVIQPSLKQPSVFEKFNQTEVPINELLSNKEIKSYKELDDSLLSRRDKKSYNQTYKNVDNTELLNDILNSINKLNENLLSGKIQTGPVNLDSQLVSTNMNRNNKFRGNYGAIQG